MATVVESAVGLEPMYEEARKRPDWPKWEEAIQKELTSLEKTGTWHWAKRPPGANVVDCRWGLRIKKNAAGEIEKYKARLVAKGFTQIFRVDYYETYAPVARLASFRLLLAIAARNGWAVDTFDFDSAYLNCNLKEDEVIYLEQPLGYETRDRDSWVWRLLKALYGLNREWHGLPWGFSGQPVPVPVRTRTRTQGSGFATYGSWVGYNPRVSKTHMGSKRGFTSVP